MSCTLDSYYVSAGRIVSLNGEEIGTFSKDFPKIYNINKVKNLSEGAKVIWDLSGVKPGTYTITAAVDDGCGFCGMPMTKSVTVKECPDCKNE